MKLNLLVCLTALSVSGALTCSAEDPAPTETAALFQTNKIWTVHLTLSADQWAAMEPADSHAGGPPGGPGPNGQPDGPQFGPANFISRNFLAGDQNGDGKLSTEEFTSLADKWFTLWDKDKTGRLDAAHLREGLESTFAPGAGKPPGPGGGGPPGFGVDYPTVHASLNFNGQEFKDVAIRYKGNFTYMASRGQLKRSLKIELNEYVKGQKLADVTTLNLHSNVTDPAWMNEVLSYQFFRDAGVPAPRTAYARVYLTVPGKYDHQYVGLYTLVENIGKHFAEQWFSTKKGAIFKPETRQLFTDLGDDWSRYDEQYGAKEDLTDSQKQRVIAFARLVSKRTDAEFAAQLEKYLDIDEFARFMAATVWLSNLDSLLSMGHNFYVYLEPKNGRFAFLPWDLDLSFGKFNMGGGVTETLSIQKPWSGSNRFLERVFAVDAFKGAYMARLAELSATLGKPERIAKQVDSLAAIIRPAVLEESTEKAAKFDKSVSGQSSDGSMAGAQPGGFAPAPQRPGTEQNEHRPAFGGGPGGPGGPMSDKPVKTFVVAREKSVLDQLAGKSVEQAGNRDFPGGPGGFGPGGFLARAILDSFDTDGDGSISREEFMKGFAGWFARWNSDGSGLLTEEQLKSGITRDLAPPFAGGPPPVAP